MKNMNLIVYMLLHAVIFLMCLYFFANPLKLIGEEYVLGVNGIVIVKGAIFLFMLYMVLNAGHILYERMKTK